MDYVNILSAGHLYVIPRVCPNNNFPEQQSKIPLSVDESVQGKVSAEAAQVFAMVVVGGKEWGAPTKSLAKPTGERWGSLIIPGVVEPHS